MSNEAVHGAAFFSMYETPIATLLDAFDLQADSLKPREIVAATQQWAQGDHAQHNYEFVLSDAQTQAAYELFTPLHMVGTKPPAPEAVNSLHVLGGLVDSNVRRTKFAAQAICTGAITMTPGAPIVFWGGARPTFESEKAGVEALLADAAFSTDMPEVFQQHNGGREPDAMRTDEAVQGALVLQKYFGQLSLKQVDIRQAYAPVPRAPHPLVSSYTFSAANTPHDIVLLNGRPVDRGALAGHPRHTTESCAEEWLASRYSPLDQEDAHVMFVANNPYIGRTTLNVRAAMDAHGAAHVRLSSCGPEGAAHINDRLRLGELARRFYAEAQLIA